MKHHHVKLLPMKWFFKFTACTVVCAMLFTAMPGVTDVLAESALMTSIKVFGGDYGDDLANGIYACADNSFLAYGSAAGSSSSSDLSGIRKGTTADSDALAVKYGADNSVIWKQCFGGTANDSFGGAIQTADGGYLLVGSTCSVDMDLTGIRIHASTTFSDALIVKYDANGNVLWAKTFGGEYEDRFHTVTQTSDGGFIVAGASRSSTLDMDGLQRGGNWDMIIVYYDQYGNAIWKRCIGGSYEDEWYKITGDGNGGFIVVGTTYSNDIDFAGLTHGIGRSNEAVMARYDADGNRLWMTVFGGTSLDIFYDVCRTADGGFVASGYTGSTNYDMADSTMTGYNGLVAKFDLYGELVWKRYVGGSRQDYLNGICALSDGCLIVVGCTLSNDYDYTGLRKQTLGNAYEAGIVMLSDSGTTLWSETFGGINARGIQEDKFFKVAQLPNSQIVAAGHTASEDGDLAGLRDPSSYNNKDIVLVKYTIDILPPEITTSSMTIEISFSDSSSGVATTEYAWSNSGTEAPAEWMAYTEPVSQSAIGTWYLWVKATDNSQNSVTKCIGGPYQVGAIIP